MNWLLENVICVAAVLILAIVWVASASILGIETSGSMEAKVVHVMICMLLSWGLLLILLRRYGAKITWPN